MSNTGLIHLIKQANIKITNYYHCRVITIKGPKSNLATAGIDANWCSDPQISPSPEGLGPLSNTCYWGLYTIVTLTATYTQTRTDHATVTCRNHAF